MTKCKHYTCHHSEHRGYMQNAIRSNIRYSLWIRSVVKQVKRKDHVGYYIDFFSMNEDNFLVSGDGSCLKEHRLLEITYMKLYHRANNHFTAVGRARKSLYEPGVWNRQWKVKLQSWVTFEAVLKEVHSLQVPEISEGPGAWHVRLLCAQSSSHQIWPRMKPELKSVMILCILITTDFISTLW